MKRVIAAAFGLSLVAASAAWAQRPDRNVEQPIVRSLNWFAYVGGDDIRAACGPAAAIACGWSTMRLWEEQVRTYELFLQPDGTAGLNIGVLADQGDRDQPSLVADARRRAPGRGACGAASAC